jgi:flagellar basal body-associated protein FliL
LQRNSSSLLLALIVIIMMLFFARCGHVLYIICKLAQDATPSSEAKALLRNLSRKPVLGLLLAT